MRWLAHGLLVAAAVLAFVLSMSWAPAASFTLAVLFVAAALAGVVGVMMLIAIAEAETHPDDIEARRGGRGAG